MLSRYDLKKNRLSINQLGLAFSPSSSFSSSSSSSSSFSAPADMEASVLEALDSQRLQPILSSPFKMPKCRVSKCIYDLMDLAIQTYQGESTGWCCVPVFQGKFEAVRVG